MRLSASRTQVCMKSFGEAKPPPSLFQQDLFGGAPKERRRRCAEKRSSKRVFWRVHFFSSHSRFSDVFRANLTGAEKKRTPQNHLFGRPFPRTTPSPLLWRALIILATKPNPHRLARKKARIVICGHFQEVHPDFEDPLLPISQGFVRRFAFNNCCGKPNPKRPIREQVREKRFSG